MSERQAKKLRKQQPEVQKQAVKKSSLGFNVILAVVIAAFLAIGGYAVVNQYRITHPYQPTTVADYAKEEGISTEEFMAKWGLDGNDAVKADTDMGTAMGEMSVAKYAEYTETTFEALKEQYSFSEDVTAEMKWVDAQQYVPMSKMLEMSGMEYDAFLNSYGLTAEQITPDMLYKDAEPIINEAVNKLATDMQAAQNEADAEE